MKNVVIGVTGGIAAYKALDLVSALRKLDINVNVVMTKSAQEFVGPLSFQSMSQNPVITNKFMEPIPSEIAHITLAQRADLIVIAPATANMIAKVANGIADDFLSTMILATEAPVLVAPAMNTKMLNNKATQKNIKTLKEFGYEFVSPGSGRLACGDVGEGKLAKPLDIADKIVSILAKNKNDFKGEKAIVTAGGTEINIDPVRNITNRSSGKMGVALAKALRDRGADVTLIYGNVKTDLPKGINLVEAKTNSEMRKAILDIYDETDYVFMAAAVSDFKARLISKEKIKKSSKGLTIELDPDRDILKELGKNKKDQLLVGFAAESNNVVENAKIKLKKKNLDFIAANDISKGKGFEKDDNRIILIDRDENENDLGLLSKYEAALKILDFVKEKQEN